MEEYIVELCVRGYHIYKDVWEAIVAEQLECVREPRNVNDRYAVAVVKNEIVVGHLPKKFSRLCSLFLKRGGAVHCQVTGGRRYSKDLPQGGLEIPCAVFFKGTARDIATIKKLVNKL